MFAPRHNGKRVSGCPSGAADPKTEEEATCRREAAASPKAKKTTSAAECPEGGLPILGTSASTADTPTTGDHEGAIQAVRRTQCV
jgi:hypothetical protein